MIAMPATTGGGRFRCRPSCWSRWALLGALLATPQAASGMSLSDVIQLSQAGYSDEQLIELIQVTQARFQLDADTVITLKKAGVSETVVLTLIEAGPPVARASAEAIPPDEPRITDRTSAAEAHGHTPGADDPSHGTTGSHRSSAPAPAPEYGGPSSRASLMEDDLFSSYAFAEEDMGTHLHYALAVRGLPILILRSEANHPSVLTRAREVTRRLNQAVAEKPGGHFLVIDEPEPAVWYRTGASDPPLHILDVGYGDVVAYQRHSWGPVSEHRLADYWAALLSDYTQLFVFGRAPTELTGSHLGDNLSRIYAELASSTSEVADETTAVLEVLDHLTTDFKEHLIELATRVPAQFRDNREISR